jgi:hypothetical protein
MKDKDIILNVEIIAGEETDVDFEIPSLVAELVTNLCGLGYVYDRLSQSGTMHPKRSSEEKSWSGIFKFVHIGSSDDVVEELSGIQ